MRLTGTTLTLCLCLILYPLVRAATGEESKSAVNLKANMSVADFERCGLGKLSPVELASLERWIASFGQQVAMAATERAKPATPQVIESYIEGEFEGWEGETIFVLDNGQIWQQVEYSYMYHYAYRPKVTIVHASSGWTMTVEGVSDTIRVEQVR